MKLLKKLDWPTITLELFIVFIGLLAALQVDEWRQEREYAEAETRYLIRLAADLDAFIAHTSGVVAWLGRNEESVRHVHSSLVAGEIVGGDERKFELGLIYVGHLPSTAVARSAYDEMVAAGMFARLKSEELKREVADFYATQDWAEQNFSWWRAHVTSLSDRLYAKLEYYNDEGLEPIEVNWEEPKRRVKFNFEELASDPLIRNGFYWAADTQGDWVRTNRILIDSAQRARDLLQAELDERG